MLRLRVCEKSACLETLEKCLRAVGAFRSASSSISGMLERRATKSRYECSIDSGIARPTALKSSCTRAASSVTEPRRTCLYDLHASNRGKMVNFSGWLLPVQYQEAIAASHQHTRTFASLFDVSHMMQTRVTGEDATEFMESLTTSDLRNLPNGRAVLAVFTNENGGILDDLIVTKDQRDKYFLEKFEADGKSVKVNFLDPLEQCLVALQGPTAASVLQSIAKQLDLKNLRFMSCVETRLLGNRVRITRCGYTGEDGFEISMPAEIAGNVVEMILAAPDTKLAGLGARDSLRLEAGLCLYGHDINEETTPVEAGLTWLVAKRRREEANFPGARRILSQIESGPEKKRAGLTMVQGPPAREGASILTPAGERVGKVTSGGPSPTLGRSIAMGYIPSELARYGGGVLVEVRGKTYKATVTKMPFVKTNYYNPKR